MPKKTGTVTVQLGGTQAMVVGHGLKKTSGKGPLTARQYKSMSAMR